MKQSERRWGRYPIGWAGRKPYRYPRRLSLNEARAWRVTMQELRTLRSDTTYGAYMDANTLLNAWGHFSWRDRCFRVGRRRANARRGIEGAWS